MDILNNIPVLSELDPVARVSLKDVMSLHTSLTLENPLTFMIFLSKRPDLEEKDKDIYLKIIERLKANEKFRYEAAMATMVNAHLQPQIAMEAEAEAEYIGNPTQDRLYDA